jgi:hypothetical protein
VFAGAVGALAIAGWAAQAYETDTDLVRPKIEALEAQAAAPPTLNVHGAYTSPMARDVTARDAGLAETLLFIENTNFRFVGDIGFYVPKLVVSLIPKDPASPVVFDDPLGFSIRPHKGSVVLSGKALTALFNQHVFTYAGAPLRNLVVTTAQNELSLVGELVRRGKWAPFTMKGPITREGDHVLWYDPQKVTVAGDDATKILRAASVELDDLLKVDAVGVKLIGSRIRIDAGVVFPPPALDLKIVSAKLEPRGLVLDFDTGVDPAFPAKVVDRSSYLLARGGDVKFMRAMPVNALVQIMSAAPAEDLDFSLYEYRRQVEQGWIQLNEAGAILAFWPNYTSLKR